MKKIILIVVVIVIFLLSACGTAETVYTVVKNDISYVVDKDNQTISDGSHTYRFEFSGNSSSYNVNIVYPDGSTYWFSQSGSMGHGGWSEDYDEDRYVDGDTLCDVLIEKAPKKINSGKFIWVLILAAVGVFNIVSPQTAWYLEYGWRYKNAEPSDLALGFNRVTGGIAVVAAVIFIFI